MHSKSIGDQPSGHVQPGAIFQSQAKNQEEHTPPPPKMVLKSPGEGAPLPTHVNPSAKFAKKLHLRRRTVVPRSPRIDVVP